MPELELEPDSHIYRLDGVEIPGCTHVLTAMGATPGFNFLTPDELDFYRSRGHAVHKAVELAVKGTLDKRTVVAEINPYLIGWDRFCNDHKVEVIYIDGAPFIERPLHHPTFLYGVTPDFVGFVDARSGVVEVKATSAHDPATGLQLAAQLKAVHTVEPQIGNQRIGLRLLQKEPYYDLRYYTDPFDEAIWLSLLSSYNWLKKHKRLKER